MIAVRGCGRGAPRSSQTTSPSSVSGAAVARSRPARWPTSRDAKMPTSSASHGMYASVTATNARSAGGGSRDADARAPEQEQREEGHDPESSTTPAA